MKHELIKRWMRLVARLSAALLVVSGLETATGTAMDPALGPATIAPIFHSSFKAASDAAVADQSLVLLIFGAEWCGPCKLLKSRTLASPEFLGQENPLHVAEVDIDAQQKMAHDFGVEAVPTLVLITGDGKIISRQTGFMEAGDLLGWIQTGRKRAAAGQWEGTVPGAAVDEFIKKSAADNIGTNDIQRLVELLGDSDPANRDQAGKILLAQRENAVPALIQAVGHSYLGVRIGASELLQRLAPDLHPIDPWQSPSEMSNAVVVLQKWWSETGKLPAPAAPRRSDAAPANSIQAALEQLRGDDPAQRTAAMTELVGRGAGALPAVREALKRAERSGDQRALGLLEDVRWTILVPDAVEQQSGGVRKVLARGKSSERQAAADRLGRIGKDALAVLIELAGDPDPLVVEGTVRALSGIRGDDAISALAALLQSPDSNLRMTAAQALGHTKNPLAIKPLLAATSDPDEVVACTALSAIEEAQARDTYGRSAREVSPEIIDGLKRCLADSRWRVRASAAEAAGKLSVAKLTDDLKKLLGDSDGFVVKTALTSLGTLNATPDSAQLTALSKRLPSLQGDVVALLLESRSEESVQTVTNLFNTGNVETRIAILSAFLRRGYYDSPETDQSWKPMLAQAVAAADPRLRRVGAEVLAGRSPKVAVSLLGPLLSDEDRDIRRVAAGTMLQLLSQDTSSSSRFRAFASSSSSSKTNPPLVSAAQLSDWHQAMARQLNAAPDFSVAAALFATGDGKTDLPLLLAALANTNGPGFTGPDQKKLIFAIGAVMPKLVLPDGRPVLEKFTASPTWFAMAVQQSTRCKPEVQDYLLDPVRFKAALDPASGTDLTECLELLAGYEYDSEESRGWSLWGETDHVKALALTLIESTNTGWRAAAVFSLGLRSDAKNNLAAFQKSLADPDSWVRGSAVRAIARNVKDRATLEQNLGPLVGDTNLSVAASAAMALLEPETRQAAGLGSVLDYFEFEGFQGGRGEQRTVNDDRPLSVLDSKPAFLESARKWLAATNGEDSSAFAVLLAQFGDFSGVDRLAAQVATIDSENRPNAAEPVLVGIGLSHDPKYVPLLKQMAATRQSDSDLRRVLQAMKGMTGPDARQLRLDINKKIRGAGGASGMIE